MLLTHALTLAEARSYLAALADNARTSSGAMEYERTLLELDRLHGGEFPPTTEVPTDKRDVLHAVAEAAIEELTEHGVDALQVELVLATLNAARTIDQP